MTRRMFQRCNLEALRNSFQMAFNEVICPWVLDGYFCVELRSLFQVRVDIVLLDGLEGGLGGKDISSFESERISRSGYGLEDSFRSLKGSGRNSGIELGVV